VERLEDYTDYDIAAKLNLPKTQKMKIGPRQSVLWVRGLYDRLYQIDPAVKKAFPKGKLVEKYQRDLPKTKEELAKYGTIIMPNVPVEKMGIQNRKLYVDWVKSGGHMIILGGSFSIGQGMMKGTFFDDILPCEIIKGNDIVKLPKNSQLIAGKKNLGQIFYVHTVNAKPKAKVIAYCGKSPLLLSSKAEKGKCTVFAGTVMGAKENDPKAFWNSKLWAGVLKNAIESK